MADTDRLDELIELWNKRGMSLTESEEFIRLAIARLGDLCSGPHLSLASTEELRGELERRETEPYQTSTAAEAEMAEQAVTHGWWTGLIMSDRDAEMYGKGFAAGQSFADRRDTEPETGCDEPAAPVNLEHLEILAERREDLLREMLESLGRIEESLIVVKPECKHEWLGDNAHRAVCRKCGATVMPLTG